MLVLTHKVKYGAPDNPHIPVHTCTELTDTIFLPLLGISEMPVLKQLPAAPQDLLLHSIYDSAPWW